MLILPNNKSQIKPYIYNSWTRKYFIKSKKHIKTKKKSNKWFPEPTTIKVNEIGKINLDLLRYFKDLLYFIGTDMADKFNLGLTSTRAMIKIHLSPHFNIKVEYKQMRLSILKIY